MKTAATATARAAQPASAGYVALLRGINVGGHKPLKMAEIRRALTNGGFAGVKTLLASGNVLFQAARADEATLAARLQRVLQEELGQELGIVVRTVAALQKMVAANPFGGVTSADARLYVTFLGKKATSNLVVPHLSPKQDFEVLRRSGTEIFSVCHPSADPGSTATRLMALLEKEFGKNLTTRNWNTVVKLAG